MLAKFTQSDSELRNVILRLLGFEDLFLEILPPKVSWFPVFQQALVKVLGRTPFAAEQSDAGARHPPKLV
jgi:hypothetical protein